MNKSGNKLMMIIYGEDLAPTGFTAAELQKSGKAYDHWPVFEKSLVETTEKKITIEKTAKP
jgi:hypothetical protein